ncbi:hypothetical protein EGW08_015370 [Elysia chlorotica]|uniref:Apple domain-containing protein n=1 Tax=Elysia chlorotica TaxID=188477 RepID=A0A3S1BBP7_ELYCH|nr:hypothetical protein EGW08_015370 [Elysia chlorotica]
MGASYFQEIDAVLWDDGTDLRSDTPFGMFPPQAHPNNPCGKFIIDGSFRMGDVYLLSYGMCGNHNPPKRVTYGRTLKNQQLITTVKTVLAEYQVNYYVECVMRCSAWYKCRAAEFHNDSLNCSIIGEFTSNGTTAYPHLTTFFRQTFTL